MNYLKIINIIFIVSSWALAALKDGKISLPEWIDLVYRIAALLGLSVDTERQHRKER